MERHDYIFFQGQNIYVNKSILFSRHNVGKIQIKELQE